MANNLTELLRKYSTEPADMEKLLAELHGAMEGQVPVTPDFITPTLKPVIMDATQARAMGISLRANWLLKLIPDASEQGFYMSFITPEQWEITQDWKYISPEGTEYDYTEMEKVMAGLGGVLPGVVGAEKVYGIDAIKGYLEIYPDEFMADLTEIGRTDATVDMLKQLGAGEHFIDYVFMSEDEAATWIESIWLAGRSTETETILKDLFPGVGEEQLAEFFKDAPAPYEEESKLKDIWDAFFSGMANFWFQSKQYLATALPQYMSGFGAPATEVRRQTEERTNELTAKEEAGTLTEREAWELEEIRKMQEGQDERSVAFSESYLAHELEYAEFVKAHPELKPRPEWEGGTLDTIREDPGILKDPAYWLYVAAETAAFTLAFLGTTIVVTLTTRNPMLGLAAGVAVTTPAQSQELMDDLVNSGASIEQAAELSVPIGALISSVEVIGGIPVLKAIAPGVFHGLRREVQHQIVRATLGTLARRGLTSVTKIELAEIFEEIIQGAIQDATAKFFDENRNLLEDIPETTIRTAMATLPLAILGGGSSVFHFYNAMSPGQKTEFDDWVTKLKAVGIDEEHAKLIAAGKILETPEGQAALEQAMKSVEAMEKATPMEVLRALMTSLEAITKAEEAIAKVEAVPEATPRERLDTQIAAYDARIAEIEALLEKKGRLPRGMGTRLSVAIEKAKLEAAKEISEVVRDSPPHLVSKTISSYLEEHEIALGGRRIPYGAGEVPGFWRISNDEINAKIGVFKDFLKGLDRAMLEAEAIPAIEVGGLEELRELKEELTTDTLTRNTLVDTLGQERVDELVKQTEEKIKALEKPVVEVPPVRATKGELEQAAKELIYEVMLEETKLVPTADVVKKLTQLIREAEPVREVTERLKHEELVKRTGRAAIILRSAEGKEAFEKSKLALVGALPKADFAPPELQLTDADIKSLFDAINKADMRYFTKLNTYSALVTLLSGKIPTIGELTRLEKMFGSELVKAILDKKTLGQKAWYLMLDTLNLPRAVLAAWDLSAPLRQGGLVFVGQYKQSFPALKPMLWAFFSEENAKITEELTRANYYYEFSQELHDKLYIAPLFEVAKKLTQMEEAFMSRFARYIPLIRHSERAYVIYLNKIRMDIFASYCRAWEGTGKTMADYNSLARAINVMTGRGPLGKLEGMGAELAAVLFSPRYQMSRIFVPIEFVRATPVVRKMMARNIVSFVATNLTIISLWLLADDDASVERDPRSADAGKLKIGNTRIDFWAGFQPYFRLIVHLITGIRKSSTTGKLTELQRDEVVASFVRTKFAPAMGLASDILHGETFIGDELSLEPESVRKQIYERLTPMFVADLIDAILDAGLAGGLMALPGLLGVGVQTYGGGYWEEFIDQLGLPKQADTLPYSVNKEDIYTTKDFYGDISPKVQGLKPEDIEAQYRIPEMILSIIACKAGKENYVQRPAERYIDINADPVAGDTYEEYFKQWQAYASALTDEDKAKVKEQYPQYYMGNFSRQTLTLLREYYTLDKADQAIFLERHPELKNNARVQWLIDNPKENALLALWGQASIKTLAAYKEVNKLILELDIPMSAVEFNLPPPDSVDNYFKYLDIVSDLGANSWEAKLLMLEDDELREWLGREAIEDNPIVLEIQAKHRALTTEYEGYKDKDSPYYIENEDAREEAQQAFKLAHPDWKADMHRIDAYNMDFPEGQIEYYVVWYMGFTKKPETWDRVWYDDDRWLMDHMDFYNAMFELGVWTKHRSWAVETPDGYIADKTKIPTVKEERWLIYYDNLPSALRLQARCGNEALDNSVIKWYGLKPCHGTDRCGGGSAGGARVGGEVGAGVPSAPPEEEEETGLDKDWAREHWEEFTVGIVNKALSYSDGEDFLRGLGIDPGMHPSFLTEEQAWSLVEALEDRRKSGEYPTMRETALEEAETLKHQALEQWIKEWAVPTEEAKEWVNYPITVADVPSRRSYFSGEGVVLDIGQVTPSTLAHELAHANKWENLPQTLHNIYPYAHYLAQVINPDYKEAIWYGANIEVSPGVFVDVGSLPEEGYAMAYAKYAKEPEKMPWYLEPFYGNLMYEVPDKDRNSLEWLAYWVKSELEEAFGLKK